jgi:hypothetical protein
LVLTAATSGVLNWSDFEIRIQLGSTQPASRRS